MEITIRNGQLKHSGIIPMQIEKAKTYLKTLHPQTDLDNVGFIFGRGSRSRYFRNTHNAKYDKPMIYISCRGEWWTYDRKRIGVSAHGLRIGVEKQITLALIHELTHHIQHEQNRSRTESETTLNEINYCRENYPKVYKKLTVL